jgi:hypothetical protein
MGRVYQQIVIDTLPKSLSPSSMIARHRSPPPRSSTTGWGCFTMRRASGSRVC